jgi:hypothetical protein
MSFDCDRDSYGCDVSNQPQYTDIGAFWLQRNHKKTFLQH